MCNNINKNNDDNNNQKLMMQKKYQEKLSAPINVKFVKKNPAKREMQ